MEANFEAAVQHVREIRQPTSEIVSFGRTGFFKCG